MKFYYNVPNGQPVGIYRILDKLNRITIPKEYYKMLNWQINQPLKQKKFDDSTLVIYKANPQEIESNEVRCLDNLGRICLSYKLRNEVLQAKHQDLLELLLFEDNKVYIQKVISRIKT